MEFKKMIKEREFKNYIGGAFGDYNNGTFRVDSPFYDGKFSILSESGETDIIKAMAFSRREEKGTKEIPFYKRLEILEKTANSIDFSTEELLYGVEMTGMPLKAIKEKSEFIKDILSGIPKVYQNGDIENREPIGVIVAFTPGNDISASTFVLSNMVLTGSSGIVRPSSSEVYFTTKVAETLTKNGYPSGAINIVNYSTENKNLTGLLAEGADLKIVFGDDRTVSMIKKLGSGKTIGYGEGRALAIVDESADVSLTSKMLIDGSMKYPIGCNKTMGVRIPREVYDDIKKRLKYIAERLKVGDPRDPETEVGFMDPTPLYDGKGVLACISDRIENLYNLGALDFVLKGKILSKKQAEPVILVTGDPTSEFMTNENPAYILTLCPVDNFKEAVEQTEYVRAIKGIPKHLVISVFGNDQENMEIAKYYFSSKGTVHNVNVNKPTTYIDPTCHQGISLPHALTIDKETKKAIRSSFDSAHI